MSDYVAGHDPVKDGDEYPNCTGFLWRPEPRGEASRNKECVGSKSRFNFIILEGVETRIFEGGGRRRTDLFPQALE